MEKELRRKRDGRGKWGFVDDNDNWVIDPSFDEAWFFLDGLAQVKLGGLWGLIRTDGSYFIEPKFDKIQWSSEGLAGVRTEGKWGFINSNGDLAIDFKFDKTNGFSEGLAGVEIGGKWGFINSNGDLAIDFKFDKTDRFSEGRAGVEIGGKWGFIDTKGEVVVNPSFDNVYYYKNNIAKTVYKGLELQIDRMGCIYGLSLKEYLEKPIVKKWFETKKLAEQTEYAAVALHKIGDGFEPNEKVMIEDGVLDCFFFMTVKMNGMAYALGLGKKWNRF